MVTVVRLRPCAAHAALARTRTPGSNSRRFSRRPAPASPPTTWKLRAPRPASRCSGLASFACVKPQSRSIRCQQSCSWQERCTTPLAVQLASAAITRAVHNSHDSYIRGACSLVFRSTHLPSCRLLVYGSKIATHLLHFKLALLLKGSLSLAMRATRRESQMQETILRYDRHLKGFVQPCGQRSRSQETHHARLALSSTFPSQCTGAQSTQSTARPAVAARLS